MWCVDFQGAVGYLTERDKGGVSMPDEVSVANIL